MPIRFIATDRACLYENSRGGAPTGVLALGETVVVDDMSAPIGGRARVRRGTLTGWVETSNLSASGVGLLAASRRSGVRSVGSARRSAGQTAEVGGAPHTDEPGVGVAAMDGDAAGKGWPSRTDRRPRRADSSVRFELLLVLGLSYTSMVLFSRGAFWPVFAGMASIWVAYHLTPWRKLLDRSFERDAAAARPAAGSPSQPSLWDGRRLRVARLRKLLRRVLGRA